MKLSGLILVLAFASFAAFSDSAQKSAPAQPKTEQSAQYIVDFDQEFFTRSPFSNWMRDPFKSMPGFAKTDTDKTKSSWPKLDAIHMRKNKTPYVLLDGKKYREGQFIDPSRYISAIGENYVTISEGNYDYELMLKDDAEKAALADKKDANRMPASMKESQK